LDTHPKNDSEAGKEHFILIKLRNATGGDWAWYMTTYSVTGQLPTPTEVICRLTGEDVATVEALPIPEFRQLYETASKQIAGDEGADPE
tara:strand:+ start:780 stop:1046 length:267 start_codon:yes stop_codon:yes gene_type:complete